MKKYMWILMLSLASSWCVADEAKRASVDELMSVIGVDKRIDAMYTQLDGMLKNMGQKMSVQPDEQPIFDAHYKKMADLMQQEVSWGKIKEPITDIYQKSFSEEEIQGMLKFYKSDIGKKTLEKLPQVMQQSMQLSQSLVQGMLPKIQTLAEDLKAELDEHRKKRSAP